MVWGKSLTIAPSLASSSPNSSARFDTACVTLSTLICSLYVNQWFYKTQNYKYVHHNILYNKIKLKVWLSCEHFGQQGAVKILWTRLFWGLNWLMVRNGVDLGDLRGSVGAVKPLRLKRRHYNMLTWPEQTKHPWTSTSKILWHPYIELVTHISNPNLSSL